VLDDLRRVFARELDVEPLISVIRMLPPPTARLHVRHMPVGAGDDDARGIRMLGGWSENSTETGMPCSRATSKRFS
jgi:hypothetical protein